MGYGGGCTTARVVSVCDSAPVLFPAAVFGHAAITAVDGAIGGGGDGGGGGFSGVANVGYAGNVDVSPSRDPRFSDEILKEPSLLRHGKPEVGVMSKATNENKQAYENTSQAGSEASIIVPCSLPSREPVFEKMVIAFSFGATEDVVDEGEAGIAFMSETFLLGDVALGEFAAGFGRLIELVRMKTF